MMILNAMWDFVRGKNETPPSLAGILTAAAGRLMSLNLHSSFTDGAGSEMSKLSSSGKSTCSAEVPPFVSVNGHFLGNFVRAAYEVFWNDDA